MLQEFMTISTSTLKSNWFELALVGVAVMYARGTIIPKLLLAYSAMYVAFEAYSMAKITEAIELYEEVGMPLEHVQVTYNAFYVTGGLMFMLMAMALAFIKPVQSKTGFAYCVALCIQSLLSIAMFLNGLRIAKSDGAMLIDLPEFEFVYTMHSFVNEKMIIITVVVAWISVILSRTAKR